MAVELFIYFLLGAIIFIHEFTRKKIFKIDLITFFNFFFFLIYSFTPIMLILVGSHLIMENMPYADEYFRKNIYTPYIIFSAYLFFLAGFHLFSIVDGRYRYKFSFWWNQKSIEFMLPISYLILYLLFLVYIMEFGGLMRTIELAQAYRSDTLTYNKFAFVAKFFPLNTLLLYYTFYKYFLERSGGRVYLLYFTISVIFLFLVTVIQSSRGFLIFQLAGLYFIVANYYKDLFLKYLIPVLFSTFFIIEYGRVLFNSIGYIFSDGYDTFIAEFIYRVELKEEVGASIISNFTHPIVSLDASLARSGYDIPLRYFRDIVDMFLLILPNELLGIKEPDMVLMELNTLLLQGREKEVILPAILGFFSYAGSVVGIFIGSFIYGVLGLVLLQFFIDIYREYKSSIIFIYIFSLAYGYFVFRGVPSQILDDNFVHFMALAFLLLFVRVSISKSQA